MTAELHNYLLVGAILFVLGAIGFLTRRNLIVMMLSAEMMLHAVALNLIAFSRYHGNNAGQAFAVFIIAVAACEAAVALALFVALYQKRRTLDVLAWQELRETASWRPLDSDLPALPAASAPEYPHLTPAGRMPELPQRRTQSRV